MRFPERGNCAETRKPGERPIGPVSRSAETPRNAETRAASDWARFRKRGNLRKHGNPSDLAGILTLTPLQVLYGAQFQKPRESDKARKRGNCTSIQKPCESDGRGNAETARIQKDCRIGQARRRGNAETRKAAESRSSDSPRAAGGRRHGGRPGRLNHICHG